MSAKEYFDQLTWLEKVQPGHVLLPTLRSGFSAINCIYLASALKSMATEPDAPEKAQAQVNEDPNTPDSIRKLHMQRRTLFTDRAKLSNSFHDCQSDQERAAVSVRIEAIQNQIEHINKQLRDWKERGKLPEKEEDPTEADLMRRINALNGAISYAQGKLKVLATQEQTEKNKALIEGYEGKIRQAKTERQRAQSELRALVGK